MQVKFKKLHKDAVIPSYAKEGDAGLDLTAISKEWKKSDGGNYYEYDTGLAVEIPEGYVGLIFPRSSQSNVNQLLTNHVGVVDSSYRGSIKFRFKHVNPSITTAILKKEFQFKEKRFLWWKWKEPVIDLSEYDSKFKTNKEMFDVIEGLTEFQIGDRIGQMIIMPYPKVEPLEVDELSDSVRGTSGFGSSGK